MAAIVIHKWVPTHGIHLIPDFARKIKIPCQALPTGHLVPVQSGRTPEFGYRRLEALTFKMNKILFSLMNQGFKCCAYFNSNVIFEFLRQFVLRCLYKFSNKIDNFKITHKICSFLVLGTIPFKQCQSHFHVRVNLENGNL